MGGFHKVVSVLWIFFLRQTREIRQIQGYGNQALRRRRWQRGLFFEFLPQYYNLNKQHKFAAKRKKDSKIQTSEKTETKLRKPTRIRRLIFGWNSVFQLLFVKPLVIKHSVDYHTLFSRRYYDQSSKEMCQDMKSWPLEPFALVFLIQTFSLVVGFPAPQSILLPEGLETAVTSWSRCTTIILLILCLTPS